jgi:hypothetical protein
VSGMKMILKTPGIIFQSNKTLKICCCAVKKMSAVVFKFLVSMTTGLMSVCALV